MADDLNLKCEEMVSIPTGMRVYTNVVFNPYGPTQTNLNDAQHHGRYYNMKVKDKGGEHVSNKPHRIMSVRRERDVIIFTSQEM